MKLEEIGFYTLSDQRARTTSKFSQLMRCELLVTGACNFKCPYCRGSRTDEELPLNKALSIIDEWGNNYIENVRFSGGEPTLYPYLKELIKRCNDFQSIKNIAVSTNGSADLDYYKELIDLGVSDLSISLDACCAQYGDKMAGVEGAFVRVVNNIRELSKLCYITVGCVFTNETVHELVKTIKFASGLGVADIRIISSAQDNTTPGKIEIEQSILDKHPILKYRVNNYNNGRAVRGIKESDCHKCHLVKDDMAVEGDYHYPCIIHLRETKRPIGLVSGDIRNDRYKWFLAHNTFNDPVCQKNCLDVCVDYNNRVEEFQRKN